MKKIKMEKIDATPMTNREKQIQPVEGEIGLQYLFTKINIASNKAIQLSKLDQPRKQS